MPGMGVPSSVPLIGFSVIPEGRDPPASVHVNGEVALLTLNPALYNCPSVAVGRLPVENVIGGRFTVMENSAIADADRLSVAVTKNEYVFAVVGIPEIPPLADRLSPVGNVPPLRAHVHGLVAINEVL